MTAATAPISVISHMLAVCQCARNQRARIRSGGVRQPPTHSSSQCLAFQARQRSRIAALCTHPYPHGLKTPVRSLAGHLVGGFFLSEVVRHASIVFRSPVFAHANAYESRFSFRIPS